MVLSASDLPAIYSLLTNSLSADESVRKPAETALSQLESRPGFCSCLMVVFLIFHILRVFSLNRKSVVYACFYGFSYREFFFVCVCVCFFLFFLLKAVVNAGGDNCQRFSGSCGCSVNGFGVFQEWR